MIELNGYNLNIPYRGFFREIYKERRMRYVIRPDAKRPGIS
jgi:hypothetical protein